MFARATLQLVFASARVIAVLYCAFLVFVVMFMGRVDLPTGFAFLGAVFALVCFIAFPRSYYSEKSARTFLLWLAALAFLSAAFRVLYEGNYGLLPLAPWLVELCLLTTMCAEIFNSGASNDARAV